jgi:hypothetical protein
MQRGYGMDYVKIVGDTKMIMLCHDEDCKSYGKRLVWIPVYGQGEPVKRRLVCPSEIMTQTDYNLKFVKYESKAQMEEEEDEA